MNKALKIIFFIVFTLTALVASVYYLNHWTNKAIVGKVENVIEEDSNRIKLLYRQMRVFGSDSFPEVELIYRKGWDKIRVSNRGDVTKGSKGDTAVRNDYDLPFFGYSDTEFYLYKDKYINFPLPFMNYSLMNTYLCYAVDKPYLINHYKHLPYYDNSKELPAGSCIVEINSNWFLIIK